LLLLPFAPLCARTCLPFLCLRAVKPFFCAAHGEVCFFARRFKNFCETSPGAR